MFHTINWRLFLRLGVSVFLLGWFVYSINWLEIRRAFSGISYPWLLAAFYWIIVAVVISVIRWRIILQAQGMELGWGELWRTYWAGMFFNNFLPSSIGGDTLRVIWVGKITGDTAGAAASVVIERVLATAGLGLVGFLAGLYVSSPRAEVVTLFMVLVIVSFLLLALMMWGRQPFFLKKGRSRVTGFLNRICCHGSLIRNKPAKVAAVLIWSLIFQVSVVLVNYCIFSGLHLSQLDLLDALYVIPAASVAAMLPLGINGYGVREAAYLNLLAPYGVPAASAFAASVIFAFMVSLCSLWGGWVWLRGRRKGENKGVGFESS